MKQVIAKENMVVKISKQRIAYGLIFIFILLNTIFEQYIPAFGYLDEIVAIISMPYIFIHIRWLRHFTTTRYILLLLLITIATGIIGNVIWGYQESVIAVLKDILAYVKAPIIACALIMRKGITKKDDDQALDVAYALSKCFVTVTFVFGMISLTKDIGMSYDFRRGIFSFKFLFSHPTFLASSLVLASATLAAYDKASFKSKLFFYIETVITLILTMRDKAIAYAVLFVILVFFIPSLRRMRKMTILLASTVALVIAYFISRSKIQEYFTWSWSPRAALYTNGISVMKDCFPIGSGFATFASSISGEYYSKLYYSFGMNLKPGVGPGDYVDLGDAGAAYYIAQFGLLGVIIFITVLTLIFKEALYIYRSQSGKIKASILILGYIVISIFFENVLTNESGASVMMVLLIYLGSGTDFRIKDKTVKYEESSS